MSILDIGQNYLIGAFLLCGFCEVRVCVGVWGEFCFDLCCNMPVQVFAGKMIPCWGL